MSARRKKSEKIDEISSIYRVSAGGETTNGGDKSVGRFFAKNRQKIGDISATQDKSAILWKNRLRIPCVVDLSVICRRFFGDISPIFWRFLAKNRPSLSSVIWRPRSRPCWPNAQIWIPTLTKRSNGQIASKLWYDDQIWILTLTKRFNGQIASKLWSNGQN